MCRSVYMCAICTTITIVSVVSVEHFLQIQLIICRYTYSFFCRLRKVIESPYPLNASSDITEMLLARKSRWRKRCRRRRASLGIECRLLSPNLRYCRFSANNIVRLLLVHVFSLCERFTLQ